MNYEDRLKDLGITLPDPPKPVATYVPAVKVGNLLFLSGMLPLKEGKLLYEGRLGKELTLEQGYEAARVAVINAISVIKAELGDLDKVEKIIRVSGYVASAEGFIQQSAVINGASALLVDIFGDRGKHSRIAVGAAVLPLNSPVEIEMVVEVRG